MFTNTPSTTQNPILGIVECAPCSVRLAARGRQRSSAFPTSPAQSHTRSVSRNAWSFPQEGAAPFLHAGACSCCSMLVCADQQLLWSKRLLKWVELPSWDDIASLASRGCIMVSKYTKAKVGSFFPTCSLGLSFARLISPCLQGNVHPSSQIWVDTRRKIRMSKVGLLVYLRICGPHAASVKSRHGGYNGIWKCVESSCGCGIMSVHAFHEIALPSFSG
jgi:hypothetical protein